MLGLKMRRGRLQQGRQPVTPGWRPTIVAVVGVVLLVVVGVFLLFHAAGQRREVVRARVESDRIEMTRLRVDTARAQRDAALALAFRPFGVVDDRTVVRLQQAADSTGETLVAAMEEQAGTPGVTTSEAEAFLESWEYWNDDVGADDEDATDDELLDDADLLLIRASIANEDGIPLPAQPATVSDSLIELDLVDDLITELALDVAAATYDLTEPGDRPDSDHLEFSVEFLAGRDEMLGSRDAPLDSDWIGPTTIAADHADAVSAMEDVIRDSLVWEFDRWMIDWPSNAGQPPPTTLNDLLDDVAATQTALRAVTDARFDELAAGTAAASAAADRRSAAAGVAGAAGLLGAAAATVTLGLGIWRRTQRLEQRALTDPLTGIGNRALLAARSDVLLSDPRLGHHVVVVVDLDRFKMVNDTFGHATGDTMLVRIARGLERVAAQAGAEESTVVRLGGDEFAVTLHSAAPIGLDRLRNHLDGLRREQIEVGEGLLPIGFSYGIAMGADSPDLASLMAGADLAAYEEKRARRTPGAGTLPAPADHGR